MESTPPHHIADLAYDDEGGCAWWRCTCGEVHDGYDSGQVARLNAAEHQLPEHVQREIENDVPHTDVDRWRDVVRWKADQEAAADPAAWAWYLSAPPEGAP